MSMFRTRWREAGCPTDLIPVLCLQQQGESWKWNNNHEIKKKCSSLVRYLLGLMAPIQWILHPDENRWFWFMPIDPGVENVQLFLIYLLRFLLLPSQFNKKFIFLPPSYILTIPMCSILLGVRLLYTSLVRETKAAGVCLHMHSLLLAAWTNLWRLHH